MNIFETETEYGSIKYELRENRVILTEYRGRDISLEIPEYIEGLPLEVIGKKAFLGAKQLKNLTLPESIVRIDDWAFAFCRELDTLTLPKKAIETGQGILKDCSALNRIITVKVRGSRTYAEGEESVSYLLAAAMNKLDAFYLFEPESAGSRYWLEQWDIRMLALMEQEDTEGFSKMLLCGEEDYGSRDNDPEYYVERRRKFKVRLAMLRLIYDIGIKPAVKEKLISYLQEHKKGESSEETWKVVLDEHGDDKLYYRLLLDNGCITDENIDAVLADMGEYHTEMKAFLLSEQRRMNKSKDAFAALEFEL